MPVSVHPPLLKDFVLTEIDEAYDGDPSDPSVVTIRQATQGDHDRRNQMFSQVTRRYTDSGPEVVQEFSLSNLMRLEVMMTLAGCNLINAETNKPLFTFKNNRIASEAEFNRVWNDLSPDISQAIYKRVLMVNVDWGEAGE